MLSIDQIAYGDPFWNELLASPVLLDAVASDAASDNPLMLHFGQRLGGARASRHKAEWDARAHQASPMRS